MDLSLTYKKDDIDRLKTHVIKELEKIVISNQVGDYYHSDKKFNEQRQLMKSRQNLLDAHADYYFYLDIAQMMDKCGYGFFAINLFDIASKKKYKSQIQPNDKIENTFFINENLEDKVIDERIMSSWMNMESKKIYAAHQSEDYLAKLKLKNDFRAIYEKYADLINKPSNYKLYENIAQILNHSEEYKLALDFIKKSKILLHKRMKEARINSEGIYFKRKFEDLTLKIAQYKMDKYTTGPVSEFEFTKYGRKIQRDIKELSSKNEIELIYEKYIRILDEFGQAEIKKKLKLM